MHKFTHSILVSFSAFMLLWLLSINSFADRNAPITTILSKSACPGQSVVVPVTVAGFTNITAVSLRIDYNPTLATFTSGVANSSLTGTVDINSVSINATQAKIMISWSQSTPVTLAATDTLVKLTFSYISGSAALNFNNSSNLGIDCEYADENGNPMIDTPTATYYFNGSINSLAVGSAGAITGSSTVCAGANGVSYSIAAVTNATSYTWSLPSGFTIATGSNSNSITANVSAAAVSGNIKVTPSNTCGSGSASPSYSVMVNPNVPVSVAIVASQNPVNSGTTVTFTSTPTNGGQNPYYQWKVNGTNAGSNSSNYSYIPIHGDAVSCILTSGQICVTGNPATSNIIIMTVNGIPATTTVNGPVTGTVCYNATETINVAGNNTTFTVQSGGSATMIAGQTIHYLPGATVQSGGYMWGYISPNGPFCVAPTMPAVITGEEELLPIAAEKTFFKVYPNPTTGNFILEVKGEVLSEKLHVDVYGMQGEKVLTTEMDGEIKHEFSISDKPVGVYFIRVIVGSKAETLKIIKQ